MICNDDQHNTPTQSPQTGVILSRRSAAPAVMVSGDQMMGSDGASGGTQIDTLLHALRRNWFWCLLLGSVFAGVAGAAVWKLTDDKYTAFAELRAHSAPQDLAGDDNARPREKFETFISSVKQLIKSRSVLRKVVRQDDVRVCSAITQQADPEGWLASELNVSNPKDSEILIVSLSFPVRKEAETIVNAVIKTYMDEVELKETEELTDKKNKLEEIREDLMEDESLARTNLENLADQLGTIDPDELSFKSQIEMENARTVQGQLLRSKIELSQAMADLKMEEERLTNLAEASIPQEELQVLIAMDQEGRYLANELQDLRSTMEHAGAMATNPDSLAAMANLGQARMYLHKLEGELDRLTRTLTLKWKIDQRREIEESIRNKRSLANVLQTQVKGWEAELEKYGITVESVGKKFVNIELKRKDIERIGKEIDNISAAIARTELQLESKGRMEVISPAFEPVSPDKPGKKVLASAAGLFAFILPCVGLLFWDVRSQRVNSADEVSERLGLPIMGSVPILPSRVTRRLGGPSGRGRWWQALLSESIAGIRANLLHQDEIRVVMITSAVGGEGKTTVATQLAMSLARAGKRTALVDFDLPRPSVSSVFNLDLEPGICDILRGECSIDEVVNDTVLPSLYVLPAGVANGASTQAMNSLDLPELIHDLRESFDYVIVDGSPLVPVADARVVSRYVDGAICCVLRDVSRLSMVRRASDILDTFGVRLLGTVVTARQESYYTSRNYQQHEEALV